jgi:hypothetical protein
MQVNKFYTEREREKRPRISLPKLNKLRKKNRRILNFLRFCPQFCPQFS